jgi:hypothetical protein
LFGNYIGKENNYRRFKEAIKSNSSLKYYNNSIRKFMKFKGIAQNDFASLIEGQDVKQIESDIIDFIISLKEAHYSLFNIDRKSSLATTAKEALNTTTLIMSCTIFL